MTERGLALVLALLVTGFLSVVALGLALVVSTHVLVAGQHRQSAGMLAAAEAGIEFVAHDLSERADWDAVLQGAARSSRVDGAPAGTRAIPGGGTVSIDSLTNLLTCGRVTACTAALVAVDSRDRPWGSNNAWWRPYAYGPLRDFAPFTRPGPYYVVVWVADDGRESDGDPGRDGSGADGAGRGVLRVRSDAFGTRGARRAIEAELARVCRVEDGAERCQPGIRVQSWHDLHQVLP